jgi:hypothetical protein
MNKNGLIAALYTLGIIGAFTLVMYSIKEYPQFMGYIFTICAALLIFMVFIYPLWDTIKWELDERDKRKKSKKGCDLELDENDKAQIG